MSAGRTAARLALSLALGLAAAPAAADLAPASRPEAGLPEALRDVGIDQRLGEGLPLEETFRDERGEEIRLGDYFRPGRPVLLAFAYYRCPTLCNQVLHGIAEALGDVPFEVGRELEVVIVSIDPEDGPEQAAARQKTVGGRGWHFLTGDPGAIEAAASAAGFRYAYDAERDLWAHASGIMLVTPEGRLSRYFYGIEYEPTDLRLGLVEASGNRIGGLVDALLLYCYRYDPANGRYGAVVMRLVRIAGLAGAAGIVLLIVLLRRHERRARGLAPRGAV
jgi:protein SCO1/2